MIEWAPLGLVLGLVLVFVLAAALCLDVAVEIGRLLRLPRTIGRFAAEIANAFHQYRD